MRLQSFLFAVTALSVVPFNVMKAQEQRDTNTKQSRNAEMQAFIGSWELDPSRTKLGSFTILYEQAGDRIRVTSPGGTYTFKTDGVDYPTSVPSETASWREVDKRTLEFSTKRNGKVEVITTLVISPDGKTISVKRKMTGDKPTTMTSLMERQSAAIGGSPLIGTWKVMRDSSSAPIAGLTYTAVANGLHARYDGSMSQEYDLILDGKQRQVDSAGPNTSLTARKINDRSIEEKWTRDGKQFTASTITVSADGEELIERQQPGDAHSEPSIFVYRHTK